MHTYYISFIHRTNLICIFKLPKEGISNFTYTLIPGIKNANSVVGDAGSSTYTSVFTLHRLHSICIRAQYADTFIQTHERRRVENAFSQIELLVNESISAPVSLSSFVSMRVYTRENVLNIETAGISSVHEYYGTRTTLGRA